MIDLLIKNGLIVDGQAILSGSLVIDDGRIAARLASRTDLPAARETIDAGGRLVLPGMVDPHVHFYGEGIGKYSALAAIGGVTSFIGMIRGQPDEPLGDVITTQAREGRSEAIADFSFHVVLYDREDTLGQLDGLVAQGLRSFKVFLAYRNRGMMVSERFLLSVLGRTHRLGGIVLVHAEDGEVIDFLEQTALAESRVAPEHYHAMRPAQAEANAIEMVALCAEVTGCPAYIVHVSSAAGLAALERARRRGVLLWAETCPQYLLMDDSLLSTHGAIAKIAPPLRSLTDQRALATGLITGAINTIGSDHASHGIAAKREGNANILAAPFGMPGAPTTWPSMYTWAVERDIPLPILVRAMAETPARLFGLGARKGHLTPGADADVIIVDPDAERIVDAAVFWPHVAPSPLAGVKLKGWPDITLSRGEVIARDGRAVGQPGRAQFIAQER